MSNWISVEDELPELKRRVIVSDSGGFGVLSARLSSVGWYIEGVLDNNANITHWMPLPEPPNTNT